MEGSASLSSDRSEVATAYDELAARYDGAVGWAPQAARAKARALRLVLATTRPGDRLLDVRCGVGTEGRMLTARGRRVVGIDLAPQMVRAARVHIEAHEMAASEAGSVTGPFDAAYSFFGVLDLDDKAKALHQIAAVLRPGAPFVLGLLNRTVLHELMLAPMLGRMHGWRKLLGEVRLAIEPGGRKVRCKLHDPRQLRAMAGGLFDVDHVEGLHILLPPPRGAMARPRWAQELSRRFDAHFGGRRPWLGLGYFSLFVLRRTDD